MKLTISKSKNFTLFYVNKSMYINGNHTSEIVEKLGTEAELRKKLNGRDPYKWAKEHVVELTHLEKEGIEPNVTKEYSPSKVIPRYAQRSFNGGYLFLQQIYHELELHKICKQIAASHKFTYDLDSILSQLIFGRIIFPASKLATSQLAIRFIQPPKFGLPHIYKALGVIAQEPDLQRYS